MTIRENISLKTLNTFGLDAKARCFSEAYTLADVQSAIKTGIQPLLVLGGGSNILLTRDVPGLVLHNKIKGIRVVRSFQHKVWVEVGAGESWHELVLWSVAQGFGGLENLSLIPGTVGAAPVQNIGAYGVELKDVFVRLQAVDLANGKIKNFSKAECRFGYRDSIFKQEAKGKYCICSVVFSLTKHRHRIRTGYGDVQRTLADMQVHQPGIADVSEAVIRIRSSKLPDPAKIGNSGSFFKNPEVERPILTRIQQRYPQAPFYELPANRVKIPAGWLIEQCGWKGKRVGNTGSYEKQALVLVNHGGATGEEVRQLAYNIIDSVEQEMGIRLEPEVNIW